MESSSLKTLINFKNKQWSAQFLFPKHLERSWKPLIWPRFEHFQEISTNLKNNSKLLVYLGPKELIFMAFTWLILLFPIFYFWIFSWKVAVINFCKHENGRIKKVIISQKFRDDDIFNFLFFNYISFGVFNYTQTF